MKKAAPTSLDRFQPRLRILLWAVLILLAGGSLTAHPGRVSYSRIWLEKGEIHQSLKILTDELGEAIPLDQNDNQRVEAEEILEHRSLVENYLSGKLIVLNQGTRLTMRVDQFRVDLEEVDDSEPRLYLFAEVRFVPDHPLRQVTFQSRILEEVDERHDNFAKIELNGQTRPYVFTPRNEYTTVILNAPKPIESSEFAWDSALSFAGHGIVHIFQGYDHMLFLIGLLLVATSFLSTVKIVTAFTLGHSISLTLAALNIVQFPRDILEAIIALTIVYVALENLLARSTRKRWVISLGFGLVHGLAFAETLELMGLPTRELVTALLSFNVGIEIAQVIIVAVVIPLILAMAARTWRTTAIRAASLIILCFASYWFVQRAFGPFFG